MGTGGNNPFSSHAASERRCEAMLLGRLGHELAQVYRDTLHSPLPSALKTLVGRLEAALERDNAHPRPAMVRERSPR